MQLLFKKYFFDLLNKSNIIAYSRKCKILDYPFVPDKCQKMAVKKFVKE